MKIGKLVRRFLLPGPLRTLYFGIRYRAFVSPRAEVDVTSNLVLGRGATISAFAKVKATDGPVVIGPRASIGSGCFISSGTAGIRIGADSMIAANVAIVANNHVYDRLDVPIRTQGHRSEGIEIGHDVWIGANAAILDGTRLDAQVIVTAGAVVSGAIPARKIVSGNPARIFFERT